MIQNKWEPLLNNLGHVYRKLQMYDKAIEYHMQVIFFHFQKLQRKANFK